ncbi:murein hydrolase transporter LrgA [Roseivivax halodurans JCM 10272]|uniref:Murein hydrolase transporter LrgA n=1 Tax=Roseivivax halodurans JCM 10272 TaxID=1449350 RepID=X7EKV7_9RHOB|nr:CidA/LrgA family protein [Roseivivax halodurans]ETX15801.1 murein hydrolase transporter LrgA [Roseivivax halodurans JCM 10272]
MIRNISVLLVFQLAGESIARGLGLSIPGPVLGLAGLFVLFLARPAIADGMRTTCQGLLGHLSLLFVPAGVGVTAHIATFGENGLALIGALIGSTALAIVAGVFAFLGVARLTGAGDESDG